MASRDGTNSFAPCCLGNNCRLVVEMANGDCPLAATSRHCVVCNGVLHPLCGEIDSQSSMLTCFNCIEAYGRTFESQEAAALFLSGRLTIGGNTATTAVGNESRGGIDASEHERLVQETKRRMMPDECPRLNRSQSTKDKYTKLFFTCLSGVYF
jgi:hypothetical protein